MYKVWKVIRQYWYVFAICVLVGGYFAWQQYATQISLDNRPVHRVGESTITNTFTFTGELDAEEKSTLRFRTGGRLVWVGVKEGDRVEPYQGIASLDQQELQKRLDKGLNTYMHQYMDWEQTNDETEGYMYEATEEHEEQKRIRNKEQYELNNSVLDVEITDLSIKDAYLYTPIAGVVTNIQTPHTGTFITPQDTYFEIVNPTTLYLSALVDQTDVIELQEGLSGTIAFDAYPEDEYVSAITHISFSPVKGETGTVYQIKLPVRMFSHQDSLRIGMTADVTFVTDERMALTIPSSYLVRDKGDSYVIGPEGERIPIEIGDFVDGDIEVIRGIQKGDYIIEPAKEN